MKHPPVDTEKERELMTRIKEKSEDDYEKNITYISAGTLVLSLTFIEKIVALGKAGYLWLLITAWGLLALTLIVNLCSHQLSAYYHDKSLDEFDKKDLNFIKNVKARNYFMRWINWCTIGSLTFGIISLILFCSINAYHTMTNSKENNDLGASQNTNDLKKGRTITINTSTGSSQGTSKPKASDTSKPKS